MLRRIMRLIAIACALPATGIAQTQGFQSPSIVILGDSQIPFGSGPVFLDFFENIKTHCPPPPQQAANL